VPADIAREGEPRPTGRRWRVDAGPLRRSRQFRLLFISQGVTIVGTMITAVAIPFQAYAISHSSLVVGLLSAAEVAPYLVVSFVGGRLADTHDRRRIVLLSEVGLCACTGVLVENATLGHAYLWVLFVVAGLTAVLGALGRPSLDALVPRVVAAADIPAAVALTSVRGTVGQVVGPAVAGGLISWIHLGPTYAIDVATFAVSLLALSLMAPVPPIVTEGAESGPPRVAEGFRYASSRPDLLGSYAVDMAAMFFGMPEALFPQLATRFGGAGVLGLLYAAPALGAFVVSVTAGWVATIRRRGRAIVLAAGSWGLAIVAFGFAHWLWLALAVLVVSGGFDMVSGLMRMTLWNQTIPDALRGRMAGIELVSFSSGPALGNVEAGVAESLVGLRTSIVFGGIACVVATAVVALVLPGLWRSDTGPPPGAPPAPEA
jgi:MFS family permease